MSGFYAKYSGVGGGGGAGVSSLNLLTGALTLAGGAGISITDNGVNTITVASTLVTGNLTDVGTDGITITGGTGAVVGAGTAISQHVADSTHNGYLSSTDWTTFNNKQAALTFTDLSDAGTDGITITNGTGAVIGASPVTISQHVADATYNGYLLNTDWVAFNAKQPAGNYITALTGDATASGPGSAALTLATVNANVGSFGSASSVATFTANGKGLITAAGSTSIQIAESQVTNLVSDLAAKQSTTLTSAHILVGNVSNVATDVALSGDATLANNGALTLATVNTNVGSFGSASSVSAITVNAKGLITAAASTSIQIAESQVTNLVSDLAGKQPTGNYITALTGDATASGPGSAALTLATVNANVGSFGDASTVPSFTVNGKGLITAASSATVIAPAGTLTGATLAANVLASSLTSVGTIATGVWNGTAVDVAHGGTGQTTYTDGQLLIGNSSGNTLTKATLSAGSNITVTNGNGTITIAATPGSAPQYTVVSQNSTLNPAVLGRYYKLSGASFSITLPTAVGVDGQTMIFEHLGTSLTQVYTFSTTSAQTIGGVASGSYALYTNGEALTLISDGANWQILDHKVSTGWSSSTTITIGAVTTPPTKSSTKVTDSVIWKRNGDGISATIRYNYYQSAGTGGAIGSGDYLFTIPLTVDTGAIPIFNTTLTTQIDASAHSSIIPGVGHGVFGGTTYLEPQSYILYSSTQFRVHQAVTYSAVSSFGSGNAFFNNASAFFFEITVPVSGWQP